MTRAVRKRVTALENAIGTGRVSVCLSDSVEDEAKAVEEALRAAGYDPAKTQVVSIWRADMFDEPFASPYRTHEEWLEVLASRRS